MSKRENAGTKRTAKRKKTVKLDHSIETDGRVVWINGIRGLLGRFSRHGIDVHVNGKCKDDSCVAEICTFRHWRDFQKKMLKYHGVEVPDQYMPNYLKTDPVQQMSIISNALQGIADATTCPDRGEGGCVGGPIRGFGCIHEAAAAGLRALRELELRRAHE